MVNHIVMWNFNPELTEEERMEAGRKIRRMLLHVAEEAKGVFSLQVYTNELASSNRDINVSPLIILGVTPLAFSPIASAIVL